MKPIMARYLDISRVNLIGVFLEFREKRQSSQCFPIDVTPKNWLTAVQGISHVRPLRLRKIKFIFSEEVLVMLHRSFAPL